MGFLRRLARLPGEGDVLVRQFLNKQTLGVRINTIDLVPEQFRDALLASSNLVTEPLVLLAQEVTFDLEGSRKRCSFLRVRGSGRHCRFGLS